MSLVVGAACATNDVGGQSTSQLVHCKEVITVEILDFDGNQITTVTSEELPSVILPSQTEAKKYERRIDDPTPWNNFHGEINRRKQATQEDITNFAHPGTNFIYGTRVGLDTVPEYKRGNLLQGWVEHPTCPEPHHYEEIQPRLSKYCSAENVEHLTQKYCLSPKVVGQTVYVTITSPGGSSVKYYYPKEWLNNIMWANFGDKSPIEFSPQFLTPDGEIDEAMYYEYMAEAFVGNGKEVISFTLALNDFEGRSALRPIIAQAMLIAAAQEDEPVFLVMKGMNRDEEISVANVTATQNDFNIVGSWMTLLTLGAGSIAGNGGGGELQASYTSSYENLTYGSIFIVNKD